MHGIVAVGGGGVCDEVRDGWFWVVVAGFLGGGVGVGGGVAVGAWWVYCFLSRREGDQRKCWEPEAANPKFQDRIWSAFCALRVRVGRVGWFAGRGNADLQSGPDSGKFEKLLRSDPRPKCWLWWCRVCLLFENSIVCQVC